MEREIFGNAKRLALAAIALMMIYGAALGQQIRPQQPANRAANMGKGMALITPGLMEIGVQTKFFLTAADRIKLTDEQRTRLTEIAYQFQKLAGEKKADHAYDTQENGIRSDSIDWLSDCASEHGKRPGIQIPSRA